MKGLLTSLAVTSLGLGLSSQISLPTTQSTTQENNVFAGTKNTNIKISKSISDAAMGSAKQDNAEVDHSLQGNDLQINPDIVPKMDLTRSWLKVDMEYGYSDNSGSGHSNTFNSTEDLIITSSNFDTGKRDYDNERHHVGANRHTDHQGQGQVKVNNTGISFGSHVGVGANGNGGNRAVSNASITIESFEYHFEFYA